jgi:hypothetical protein
MLLCLMNLKGVKEMRMSSLHLLFKAGRINEKMSIEILNCDRTDQKED